MDYVMNRSYAKQIVVVDTAFDDYQCFKTMVQFHTIRMALTTSGAGGLRLAPSYPDALWLICLTLSDMSGLDLLEMIRATQPRLSVFVVDSAYDAARERHALQLSATGYFCKPVQPDWITHWQGAAESSLRSRFGLRDSNRFKTRQESLVRNY